MTYIVSNILNQYSINSENNLLHFNSEIMTHGELNKNSDRFASYLLSLGVKKNDRIVLMLDLNIETIIAIIGIIKIGAIYVPLDKNLSDEVVEYILYDTNAVLCIIDTSYKNKFTKFSGYKIIYDSNNKNDGLFYEYKKSDVFYEKPLILPKDIVYIIYTSGTTGRPKGVIVNHMSIMTFLNYVTKVHNHGKNIRSLCRTPISFDPFLTEVLPSIMSGGQVYIQDRDVSFRKFLKFLDENKISNFGCGPSMLFLMADNLTTLRKFDLSELQDIYIGYEKCPVNVIKILQKELTHVNFINGYGTTETFACSTFYFVDELQDDKIQEIPIGDAIEGIELFIITSEGNKAEANEIGELVIRGNTIFNGYWHDETETKNKLRLNPLFPDSNELVYFTGDLVRMDDNCNIFFVGRKDDQVKINGYRVELGEIKYIIETNDNVKECCIIYDNNELICMYNTYDENNIDDQLIRICYDRLAPYKRPGRWLYVKVFERNANGKIDIKRMKAGISKYEL